MELGLDVKNIKILGTNESERGLVAANTAFSHASETDLIARDVHASVKN